MSDELSVKISAELDTTKADSQLEQLKSKIAKEKTSIKIDTVQINQKAVNSSLKAALSAFSKSAATSPIKLTFDVNRTNTRSMLSQFAQSLQSNPIKIPVQFVQAKGTGIQQAQGMANGNNGNGGNGNNKKGNKKQSGVPYNRVVGGTKFKAVFDAEVAKYRSQFESKNKNYTLASSSVKYDPVNKQYSALIKYQDALGKTTSMLMRMDEKTQKVRVTQTGFSENFSKEAKEIEKTNSKLEMFRNTYKSLYSKAFSQKNPLTGTFGDEAAKSLDAFKNAIESVKGVMSDSQLTNIKSFAQDAARVIKEQQSAQYSATNLSAKDVTKQVGTEQANLSSYINQLKQAGLYTADAEAKLNTLRSTLNSVGDSAGLTSYLDDLRKTKAELDAIKSSFKGQALQTAQSIDTNQLVKLTQFQDKLTTGDFANVSTAGIEGLRTRIVDLIATYQGFQTTLRSDNLTEDQFNNVTASLEMLNKEMTNVSTTMKNLGNQDWMNKMDSKIEKLRSNYETLKSANAEAFANPEIASTAAEFERNLRNVDAVSFGSVQAQFSALSAKIKEASTAATGFGTEIKNVLKSILGLSSITTVINKVISGIKEIASNVTEINFAMTELKKVTDLSDAAYDNFLGNVGEKAKTIGTTMTDLINSTAAFSRLGFNFEDAQTLAEAANVYYRVGDEISDIDDASQSITSTMQAFGYSADEALAIVDKMNAAGNNMAISSGGIGTALQSSASALAAANNSLDESIALISAARYYGRFV